MDRCEILLMCAIWYYNPSTETAEEIAKIWVEFFLAIGKAAHTGQVLISHWKGSPYRTGSDKINVELSLLHHTVNADV